MVACFVEENVCSGEEYTAKKQLENESKRIFIREGERDQGFQPLVAMFGFYYTIDPVWDKIKPVQGFTLNFLEIKAKKKKSEFLLIK